MKKISFVGMLVMIFVLTSIISCDKEDAVDPIVGTWEYFLSEEGYTETITFTFNLDNTGSLSARYVEDGETETESYNFTYSANATKLNITGLGDMDEFSYTIFGNKLTLTFDSDGGEVVLILTKK